MGLKSELQHISDEDEILTSARHQFIHNYGNQYALNVFTEKWCRFKLTLNILKISDIFWETACSQLIPKVKFKSNY